MQRLRQLLPYLGALVIIAAIAFAFFYPDASQGNVLRQHDMQQGVAIGQEALAYQQATGETSRWTNSLFSGMPTFQISPSYPSTKLFSWINTVMGLGLPTPSSLIAMMMTGFFILLLAMGMRWYVALTGAIAYGFSSYFVIIIGAGHIWKFLTLAYCPPTIAGIILAYRGRYLAGGARAALFAMLQIASNHAQMTYYFLFVIVGVVVAFLIAAIRTKGMRRFLTATGVLAVAGVLAVGANLPSLYNTYEYSKETIRGTHSLLSSGAKADATGGLNKDYITQYSYQPSETFSLLIPDIKGGATVRPAKGSFEMLNLASLPEAAERAGSGEISAMDMQYLGNTSQYFGDPEGTNGPVYVGALICAFFLLGCCIVRGPLKWALVVLTLLSIVLAWGRHAMWATDLMLSVVPMYSKFRTVESILVIAEFTMPLLAAMALQRLAVARNPWHRYRRQFLWCFGIAGAFCLLGWIAPGLFGSAITDNDRSVDAYITQMLLRQGYDSATASRFSLQNPAIYSAVESLRYGMVKASAFRSLIILLIGAALTYFYMRRRINGAVMFASIAVIVVIDLYTTDKRYLNHESFVPARLNVGAPIAKTQADEIILQDTDPNYRVMDIPRFNQADPSYYHKMIGGYHAAKLTRYQDLIDRHLSHFQQGTETDADWNVLNMLNARYIVGLDGQVLRNPEAYGNAWFVDRVEFVNGADAEMAALSEINPRVTAVAAKQFEPLLGATAPADSASTVTLTSYAPNSLVYRSSSATGGTAVFSEVWFPWGWEATIDGKPVEIARVDYVLRALPVPAGEHEIVMTFEPGSLRTTDTLACVSIILIYLSAAGALGVYLFGKRRKA